MSPIDAAIEVSRIGINAVALWLAWHCLWRKACQERFRQKLFDLRDELFDYALTGKISFTDPAYVQLRSNINGMIRFSHLISVTRLFTFVALQRYIGEQPMSGHSLRAALSEIQGRDAKETMARAYAEMQRLMFWHLLVASPHILVIAPVLSLLNNALREHDGPSMTSAGPAIELIEVQANEAFKSEAFRRHHERELASV